MQDMDEQDEKPENWDRFWDDDLEVLGEMLDQFEDEETMDLEELDGFFAALACCPVMVLPSEFIPVILGREIAEEPALSNEEALGLFLDLVGHHWNQVIEAFATDDFFEPLLLEDEDGKAYGNNWAIGFMRGIALREEAWREIFKDEDKFAWLIPILALVHENDPDPEMRTYKEPMTEERREHLLIGVSAMVTHIYRYFAPERASAAIATGPEPATRRTARKMGRNDPCYCGSGKKYKKCCGAIKVN
jgi:uncharacterized protein